LRYLFQATALMLEHDYRHQAAAPIFQGTTKDQVNNPLFAALPEVMRRCQGDFLQVDFLDELWIGVVKQKIDKHKYPTKHLFSEGIEDVARL